MTAKEKEAYFMRILCELSSRELEIVRETLEHIILQQKVKKSKPPQ